VESVQPWQVDDVRERVGKRLTEFLEDQRPQMTRISPDIGELVDVVSRFVAGGKRLRAVFLYWGWRAAGRPDCEPIIAAAASMELLQACALIHDDVMDRSDSRRGQPAVHRQFQQLHSTAGWAGSGADFGTGAAILVGDLCLTWADTLLFGADLAPESLRRAKPVYDDLRSELMAGQYLDILEQARRTPTVESALRVATYKSAKYTIERPLQIGAELAGAPAGATERLRTYGVSLGQAFQLRDDLLGVFGDPTVTGKPAGDDLREGKRTALVALAIQRADDQQRTAIESVLGTRDADAAAVAAAAAAVAATGARDDVERMIADAAAASADAIDDPAIETAAADVLRALIDAATQRRH
jgi:geranylgeranyl diphosphate synthase type I